MSNLLKYNYHFKICGLNYRIRSNSSIIINFLERYFSLFKSMEAKTGFRRKDILMDMRVQKNEDINHALGNNSRRLYKSWINNFSSELLFLHSSSLELENKYLLFFGECLSGKSTMAAMLRDCGARVLNDDSTPIEYKTSRILSLPIFANIRNKGNFSNLQKKYLNILMPFLKESNIISRMQLPYMSEQEFNAYYSYNKELYDLNGHSEFDRVENKKLIAIYLKRNVNGISERLEKIGPPQSFNIFIEALLTPRHVFNRNLHSVLRIFAGIEFYILQSPSVKKAVGLIKSNFGC